MYFPWGISVADTLTKTPEGRRDLFALIILSYHYGVDKDPKDTYSQEQRG